MKNTWRRFEVMLPLTFNDGRPVDKGELAEAVLEIVAHFGAASYESYPIEGHWIHEGVHYRDNLAKVVVDVPDTQKNRRWMKQLKARWKERLGQLELWVVSYRIDIE